MTQMDTDVLVLGAGPAGAAAARVLAAEGARVVLADRHGFPRDKVCGDALIPDALQALGELGIRDRVLRAAHVARTVRIYAPDGRHVAIAGECACLPRAELDDALLHGAIDAGASFLSPLQALAPIETDGVVQGAILEAPRTREQIAVRAGVTILATGAASEVLKRFGMCLRVSPSATAARCYVRVDSQTARQFDHLTVSYDAAICPGYGWIFPGPHDTFNIGIGYVYGGAPAERNVRALLERFVAAFPPAAELMHAATETKALRGAPLRTAMTGARTARPGLLVVGEAAGLTYSFTGEGIGKALQSGILAARTILAADGRTVEALRRIGDAYSRRLTQEFGRRFRAYARLERLMSRPWMANFLVRRANAGSYVRSQLESLLNETGPPEGLLSIPGVIKALLL